MEESKLFELSLDFWLRFASLIIGLVAVFWDLKYRKIPNWLTFPAILAGLSINLIFNSRVWYFSVLGLMVGFLVFSIPFGLGGIGAGDVKLLMALGAFLGAKTVVWIAIYGGIAGGLISLFEIFRQNGFTNTKYRLLLVFTSIWHKGNRQISQIPDPIPKLYIPYGLAIFIGLMVSLV
jgi:prepilin peptidase CpaA